MKRILSLLIVSIILVSSYPPVESAPSSSWTIMIYMAGGVEPEINRSIERDLNEIRSAGYDSSVNIIILKDGNRYGDSGVLKLEADGFTTIPLQDLNSTWTSEVDMSRWETLRDFVSWSMENYPSRYSMLIFWGHGRGWEGMPADEGYRVLSFGDVRRALSPLVEKHGKFDIIGFDQCNMAMFEVFSEISGFARYAVASEKEEDLWGWPYDTIFPELYLPNSMDPLNFSRVIVKEYVSWAKNNSKYSSTLSAVNLSMISDIEYALKNYSTVLRALLPYYKLEIAEARENSESYDKTPYPYDLYNLTENIDRTIKYPHLYAAGKRLRDAINMTVVAEAHHKSSGGMEVAGAHGISIWFPTYGSTEEYKEIRGAVDGGWSAFLDDYYHSAYAGKPNLMVELSENDRDGDGANESFTVHAHGSGTISVEVISGQNTIRKGTGTTSVDLVFSGNAGYYTVLVCSYDGSNISNFRVLDAIIERISMVSGKVLDPSGRPLDAIMVFHFSSGNRTVKVENGRYELKIKEPLMAEEGDKIPVDILYHGRAMREYIWLNSTYISADFQVDYENPWLTYLIAVFLIIFAFAGALLLYNPEEKRKRMERLKSKPIIRKVKKVKKVIIVRTFIDREEELTELNTALRRAEDGMGSVIFLTGEDGVGKRTLMNRFRKDANVRFISYDSTGAERRPYEAILKVLESLNAIMSMPSKEQAFDEAFNAFVEASRERPLVVYLSNAQWLDKGSIEFLEYLSRGIEETRVILVISAPQEELEDVEGRPHPLNAMLMSLMMEGKIRMIKLERFDREKTRAMLSTILDSDIPDDILEKVYEETQGLPILIEEIANSIRNSGKNVYEMEPEDIEISRSVREIMGKRLEKLDDEEKKVVEWAAVLGVRFPVDVLEKIIDMGEALHDIIYRLVEDKILVEEEGYLKFDHPQLRKMVCEWVEDRAKEMHIKAGEVMEEMHPDDVFSLAYHFCYADERDKCLKYSLEAAKKAEESYSPKDAIEYYRMAEKSADEKTLPEIYLYLAKNLKKVMEIESAEEYARKAAEYGGEIGDRAHLLLGHIYLESSRWDEAIKEYEKAIQSSLSDVVIDAYRGMGKVYWRLGEHDKAAEHLKKAIKLSEDSKNVNMLGICTIDLANVYSDWGKYEKAIELYLLAIKYLESVSNISEIARAYNNLGEVYKYMENLDKAIEAYKKCVEYAESTKEINHLGYGLENLGTVYVYQGRFEEAVDYLSKAYRIFSKTGDKYMISGIYMAYGIMYGMQKKWEKAEENFKKSIELLEEIGIKYDLAITMYEYGKILKEKGDERAREVLEKALQLFMEIGSEKHIENVEKLLQDMERRG